MRRIIKNILLRIDNGITRRFVLWLWPQYRTSSENYMAFYQVLKLFFIPQKILRINGRVPWPVDFRSKVISWELIEKGDCTEPGDNPGQYINASGGLKLGNHVLLGPNVVITTTNHAHANHGQTTDTRGVVIGNHVWIGANCTIVAGTSIGDNVTIGAGCTIKGTIPSNCLVVNDVGQLKILEKS